MQGHRLILPHDTVAREARVRVLMGAIMVGVVALAIAIAQVKISLTSSERLQEQVHDARVDAQSATGENAEHMKANAAAASAILQKLLDDAKKAQEAEAVPASATPEPAVTDTPSSPEEAPQATPDPSIDAPSTTPQTTTTTTATVHSSLQPAPTSN